MHITEVTNNYKSNLDIRLFKNSIPTSYKTGCVYITKTKLFQILFMNVT